MITVRYLGTKAVSIVPELCCLEDLIAPTAINGLIGGLDQDKE